MALTWLGSALVLLVVLELGAHWLAGAAPVTESGTPLAGAHQPPSSFWRRAVARSHQALADIKTQTLHDMAKGVSTAKFTRGDRAKRVVALTFDDGPHPGKTEPLLKILADHNLKATFFVVGMMAEKYPWLVKAEADAGHEIGNHTYNHINLAKCPPGRARVEILACDEVVRGITGRPALLLRPPGGQFNATTVQLCQDLGDTMVLWTDDPGDYDSPGEEIILQRTVRDISNGGVILLHDGIDQTLAILPRLIRYLQARGYTLVTAGELIARTQS
jgi:peptidoglycan/xylan/chitin deacetylase (PgdA/CDA1 family)